jgi:serine phosphatase RsbU (regulator of sigma subunit)
VPLLVTPDGIRECAGGDANLPAGIFADLGKVTVENEHLASGDQFVMYSDGVLERRLDDGSMFGLEGATAALAAAQRHSAHKAARALIRAVVGAATAPPRDDATVLVLHRT